MYSLLTRAPLLYARALVTVSYFNCDSMASFVFADTVRHVANDALQIVYAKLCRTSRGLTPPRSRRLPIAFGRVLILCESFLNVGCDNATTGYYGQPARGPLTLVVVLGIVSPSS